MATEFRLPELGEGITEADVIRVLVKAGDTVAVDQPIATIETEKATVDVPSSVAGVVTQVHVQEGQTVSPGAVVLTVEDAGASASPPAPPEATPAGSSPSPESSGPAPGRPAPSRGEGVRTEPTPTPPPAPVPPPDDAPPASAPSGPGESAPVPAAPTAEVTSPPEPSPPPSPPGGEGADTGSGAGTVLPAPASTPAPNEGTNPFASPSVRMFAREIGVDINSVRGAGPAGRIDEEDVKRHARERASGGGGAGASAVGAGLELPDFTQFGPVERESLSRFRRTVARNMTASWTIPQVTLFSSADLGALEGVRRRYRDAASKAGGTLTTTALLLKIVATGLLEFPHFNATLDEAAGELILKKYVHVGMAVDTERGLAVSVVRDVDQKDIVQLAVDVRGISDRVKANTLTLDEMRGASFTISSLETLGVEHFTPLVNWPEVAILGIGRGLDLPSYANDELSSRRRMALSLSFDHRVVDGADGARFLRWLVNAIQEPTMLDIPGSASDGAAS